MNNLQKFQNNQIVDKDETQYLYFSLGKKKYAVEVSQVVEIMKLPYLEYPQKLKNNVIGLLGYNNFTLNVLDLRFYLNVKVTPYSLSNQLLVVKTDESMFGLIADKVEDIVSIENSSLEYNSQIKKEKIVDFSYRNKGEIISVINLNALENILKKGVKDENINISSLFPNDDDSRYKLMQRNTELSEKSKQGLVKNIFSQDEFISFLLGQNVYCISLEYVKEFLKDVSITTVPCTPDYIAGIITLRGDFITVVDVKNFLGIPYKKSLQKSNGVIILETVDFKIGFLTDEIFDIMNIAEELIIQNSYNRMNKYILSEVVIDDKLYKILNMKNILSDERFFIEE
ncbi:MAG TPA: chemotaxis protein CheW [Candidatus Gastranaerophilaceae bacterium]|nr:chemotaxis protein CheW [Candidatus Gastranaerophilaceae bacterium]HPT41451.1 chemotaxis protein CheW [Candidatus Gastranaerophilaceae bacterium]